MPRVRRLVGAKLPDLLAAAVGATAAGAGVTAGAVCEFSCSCCRSSTALAADALCTYLLTDQDAVGDFLYKADGMPALQTGVGSSNDAVVCACIRVSGALLQAMLAASQQQLSTWCGASNNSSIPRQHRQQGQQQWLSEDGALLLKSSLRLGRHESYAAAAAAHAQAREKQNATRGAALPGSHNNSTAAGAAPPSVSMLVPLSSTGANSSCWAVADDTSSSFGDLVAAAGSVLTHVAAAAASLQHTADARVAAFQELQQLMLLLADANVQAANTLTAQPLPPPTHQQPWVGSISGLPIQQQNGMCGGASSSIAAPDSASAGGCRSFSSGQSSNSWSGNSNSRAVLVAALTGPAQLQQVLQAAMHALTDPQASLRRAASQALAAALVLQESAAAAAAAAKQSQRAHTLQARHGSAAAATAGALGARELPG